MVNTELGGLDLLTVMFIFTFLSYNSILVHNVHINRSTQETIGEGGFIHTKKTKYTRQKNNKQ